MPKMTDLRCDFLAGLGVRDNGNGSDVIMCVIQLYEAVE
jgi:hypothetical protein